MKTHDHLQARQLTIVDSAGNPKILLYGGTEQKPSSSISLFSAKGHSLHIQEQPDGFITVGIDGPNVNCELTLSHQGLVIRNGTGNLGVTIGKFSSETSCDITVYRDG